VAYKNPAHNRLLDRIRSKSPKRKAQVDAARARWRLKNKAKEAARAAERAARKPAWADNQKLRLAYHLAKLATQLLGKPYVVDHIVPIRSKLVCGLHVHHNLRVICKLENQRKSNLSWPGMPKTLPKLTLKRWTGPGMSLIEGPTAAPGMPLLDAAAPGMSLSEGPTAAPGTLLEAPQALTSPAPSLTIRTIMKNLSEKLLENPAVIEGYLSRRLSAADLAKQFGYEEGYMLSTLSRLGVKREVNPVSTYQQQRQNAVLAETRREFREFLAMKVANNKMTLKKAAEIASCSERTIRRYVEKVQK